MNFSLVFVPAHMLSLHYCLWSSLCGQTKPRVWRQTVEILLGMNKSCTFYWLCPGVSCKCVRGRKGRNVLESKEKMGIFSSKEVSALRWSVHVSLVFGTSSIYYRDVVSLTNNPSSGPASWSPVWSVSFNQVSEESLAIANCLYHSLSPAAVAGTGHMKKERGTSASAVSACVLQQRALNL